MKKLFFAVTVIVLSVSVNAQTTFEIGANVGTGTKTGATTTYGADAQVNFKATKGFDITADAGVQSSNFKVGNHKFDNTFFLAFLGGLFNIAPKFQGHAQLGYAANISSGGSGGHFSFAPSLIYWLTANLNLALKYLSIDTYNAVLLRLAYKLSGKK